MRWRSAGWISASRICLSLAFLIPFGPFARPAFADDDDPWSTDGDGDGFTPLEGDCDDDDEGRFPGAPEGTWDPDLEVWIGDGVDNDCDGVIDDGTERFDDDGDGFCEGPTPCLGGQPDGDCDDGDRAVHPDAAEMIDGLDNDCDGYVDEQAHAPACAVGEAPVRGPRRTPGFGWLAALAALGVWRRASRLCSRTVGRLQR